MTAVPKFNAEFLGSGCTDATVRTLIDAAKKDPTYPDPLSYIAKCQWKAKDFSAACASAQEYERRGAPANQVGALRKLVCK
jgi:hypothetical protein